MRRPQQATHTHGQQQHGLHNRRESLTWPATNVANSRFCVLSIMELDTARLTVYDLPDVEGASASGVSCCSLLSAGCLRLLLAI